ncbi:uncharacterized protein YjbI with pentapeptide repeats [Tahibacter aquaticus]|uniref:Uncharacterized protein YjbI with pentapeptide repeats n=1 Tax=Tahibacter aquaticus TaxID=520092 RepID=A0A4R6Z779_9GAMM|nr:pentapeptide repeat-containing protein [Tahibacter aquaticus]TDR47641.1 uncharacterized protein YjbI with pentapeptide repeats [Tahibacter aquaticus]
MHDSKGQSELKGRMPELEFERKFLMSIVIGRERQYLAKFSDGVFELEFTTDRNRAQPMAMYRVRNAAVANTYMLQAAPTDDARSGWAGSFLAPWGSQGLFPTMFTYVADARRFVAHQNGETLRLQDPDNRRFYVAARSEDGKIRLWAPSPGELFENATWQTETTLRWNRASMANADLRYVLQLRNICFGSTSFAGANLRWADFSGANLYKSDFRGAGFDYTLFAGATLSEADFSGVTAKECGFQDAIMFDTDFRKTDLRTAVFGNSTFQRAKLGEAKFGDKNLVGCDFRNAKMAATDLRKATLTGVDFSGADMPGVLLDEANAQRAVFRKATLTGAQLYKAQLQGADFGEAVLTGARLFQADLTSAKFVKAVLTKANIGSAVFGTFSDAEAAKRTTFSEATLYEIDFSGCDLSKVTIARPATFVEATTLVPDAQHRRAILANATVPLAVLGSNWRMLDLSGATIQGKPVMRSFIAHYCNFPDNYNLEKADLTYASFRYARMTGVILTGATSEDDKPEMSPDFSHADLTSAKFNNADLYAAKFTGARLHGAKFTFARLEAANFDAARLESLAQASTKLITDLSNAYLLNAVFSNAYLGRGTTDGNGANFSNAVFFGENASLAKATMDHTQFGGAYLAGLDFTGVDAKAMLEANFVNACLANCKFKGAALSGVNLSGACLLGTDFTDCNLSGAQLGNANISFQPVPALNVRRPDGVSDTLRCGPTIISTNATDRTTTCPIGGEGPCDSVEKWTRRGGVITQWPAATPSGS